MTYQASRKGRYKPRTGRTGHVVLTVHWPRLVKTVTGKPVNRFPTGNRYVADLRSYLCQLEVRQVS